jgi:hypothetical protein
VGKGELPQALSEWAEPTSFPKLGGSTTHANSAVREVYFSCGAAIVPGKQIVELADGVIGNPGRRGAKIEQAGLIPPRISPCLLNVSWLCGIFVANTADWAGFAGFTDL